MSAYARREANDQLKNWPYDASAASTLGAPVSTR
jgi:hypothetical protein